MTTWAHEQMARQWAEEEDERRQMFPDRGLYSEYNQQPVIITFKDGTTAQGYFHKTYNQEKYELNVYGNNHIMLTPEDIKSIRRVT